MKQEEKGLFVIQETNENRLSTKRNILWVENVSFSGELISDDLKSDEGSNFLGVFFNSQKINIVIVLCLLGLGILFIRAFYLQIIRGEHYSIIAEGNRIREKIIKPARGVILDRNGLQLVENIPTFSLYFIPADLPKNKEERIEIFTDIHGLLQKYGFEENLEDFTFGIEDKLSKLLFISYEPIIAAENLQYDEALLLKIMSHKMAGINVATESRRKYLFEKDGDYTLSLSHILGYMGRISPEKYEEVKSKDYEGNDYIGKNGIEFFYENVLRGVPGRQTIEVNAIGKPKKVISEEIAISGKDLSLTIDFEMQSAVENLLTTHLKKNGKEKASVVIMDPRTGEILTLISFPSYDSNYFARGITVEEYQKLLDDEGKPLFNRAIAGEYPPGSTFKLVVGATALEEGIVDFNTLVKSVGGISIQTWFFPDWKAGGHGFVNITRAISESVNTYFYLAGGGDLQDFEGLGVERIKNYGTKFGFSKQLGIDILGEGSGFLPDPEWKEMVKGERWYIGDTYHLAIGQGDVLVTPLQIAAMTSVFANNGILYKPYLVKDIDSSGKNKPKTEKLNQDFITADNLEIIRYGMRKAVTEGSARNLYNMPLQIAGKTGTAQWSDNKTSHAWFTSFAPFKKPEIVVTIIIEEGGEGSETAVPLARDIYWWYFQNRYDEDKQ